MLRIYKFPVAVEQAVEKAAQDITEIVHTEFSFTEDDIRRLLTDACGVSERIAISILNHFGTAGVIDTLKNNPEKLMEVRNIKTRKLAAIMKSWENHLETC